MLRLLAILLVLVSSIIGLAYFLGDNNAAIPSGYPHVSVGGFSPDGTKFLVNFMKKDGFLHSGYLDLQKRRFVSVAPTDIDQAWNVSTFSNDGKKIAVGVRRRSEKGSYGQIGIVDLETKNLVEITRSISMKSSPTFSHDGSKILFLQASRERESGKRTRFSNWDIYEIELQSRKENQLTNFRFYAVSSAAYLEDDKRFIFSGEGQDEFTAGAGMSEWEAHQANSDSRDEYQRRYQDNDIFILAPGGRNLTPIFTNGECATRPVISRDGKRIVYTSRTDKTDGVKRRWAYDLFLFENGNHRRLTRLQTYIMDISLSGDGRRAAFVTKPTKGMRQLQLLNVETGEVSLIDLDSWL